MNTGLSVLASLAAAGFGIGVVVAGPIVDLLSYHWLFWLPMIATGMAALAAWTLVPESPVRTPGRIPVLPAFLLSAWLLALLLGLSQGNTWSWRSSRVLVLFAVAALLAGLWMLVETRVPVALIDIQIMRLCGVWTANVVALFVGFGIFAALGFLPQLVQTPTEVGYGFGASITESARLLLPSATASASVAAGVRSGTHASSRTRSPKRPSSIFTRVTRADTSAPATGVLDSFADLLSAAWKHAE